MPRQVAYRKFPNPASRYAVVGVMVAVFDAGVRVGVTGAGPCAFRARTLEEALNADLSPAALDGVDVPDAGFNNDLHDSGEYRAPGSGSASCAGKKTHPRIEALDHHVRIEECVPH